MPAVTLSQLENHLWKAACLLKEPVDEVDFKSHAFPMLFFDRLSEIHDEEHKGALAETQSQLHEIRHSKRLSNP